MAMIIADTDVLIDYLDGVQPITNRVRAVIEADDLVTTAVTCFELLSGAQEHHRGNLARKLVSLIEVIPLDRVAAETSANLQRHLEKVGKKIGMGDSRIAGIALSHNLG